MVDKNLMQLMHNHGYTYEEIGKRLGVSRQRVHQLITGYKNFGKRKGRIKKYWYKMKNPQCELCHRNTFVLHHVDGNNKNDAIENLMLLCPSCHTDVHSNHKIDP